MLGGIEQHQQAIDAATRRPSNYKCWRDVAPFIGTSLIGAIQIENPDYKIGISEGGPVTRFVAAIIPLITGDEPSEANVRRCLIDARNDRKNEEKSFLSNPGQPRRLTVPGAVPWRDFPGQEHSV